MDKSEISNKLKKSTTINHKGIPEFLFPLFWEYDPGTIDTAEHAGLIIGRIMERGTWASMVWLKKTYTKDQLVSFLENKGHRTLPLRELNYWALMSGIPTEKRQNWLENASRRPHVWKARHAH